MTEYFYQRGELVCPYCTRLISDGVVLAGQFVDCPYCRAHFLAPDTAEPIPTPPPDIRDLQIRQRQASKRRGRWSASEQAVVLVCGSVLLLLLFVVLIVASASR